MITARQKLLADVEAFLQRHEMNYTSFGRQALNDTAFVARLRAGKDLRFDTAEKVRQFMDEYPVRKKKAAHRDRAVA